MPELNDPDVLKNIITVASPLIKSVVDTFITPKLNSIKQRFKLDFNKYHIPTEEHFSEYFHRTYKRLSIVNTLVFSNSQKILKDIYIPLTITNHNESIKYKIDSFPNKLIEQYEKILITDTAGMGKSTMMKKIYLDIIDEHKGVPILIELRRLSKSKTIIQEIHEQINSIEKEFDEQLLLEFINEGGFIFILDGYDEISLNDRNIVTKDIQVFILKASRNKFILTSRPENALTSFGDFQLFKIQPLRKKEAYDLLKKYDKLGKVATLLINKLEDKNLKDIDQFLTNPLLVSLLFTAFQFKQTIPFKKYLFYRQVYDANFESHDLTKGDSFIHEKYTKLEVDDFHRVLRHIGFICLKEQKLEYTKDELLNIIALSKKLCIGLNFKNSDFLSDLIISVPLFTKDGNYYKWAHKSLQEYFAAQFIYLDLDENKNNFLKSLYVHNDFPKFQNVVDLFYDMDYKSFRNIFIYELLIDFKSNYIKNYELLNEIMPDDLIIKRSELIFKKDIFITSSKNNAALEPDDSQIEYGIIARELYHMFIGMDSQHFLIDVLYEKKNPIIKTFKSVAEKFDKKELEIIEDYLIPHDKKIEFSSIKKNEFILNEHYDLEIKLLEDAQLFNENSKIDLKKAFVLLDEIESDIENERKQLDLFGF